MSGPRVVLVRHGETAWSRERRHTGWTDIDLTEHGRRQAATLPPVLAGWTFSAVYVSTLRRARETCRLAGYADRAIALDDLREWHYGEYEGRTSEEIRETRPGWVIWDDGVVGGERIEQVAARAQRFLDEERDRGGDALVFAHGHLLRILAANWCGLPPVAGRNLLLGPASVSVLYHEREEPVLELWNEEQHVRTVDAAWPGST